MLPTPHAGSLIASFTGRATYWDQKFIKHQGANAGYSPLVETGGNLPLFLEACDIACGCQVGMAKMFY